MTIWYKQGVCGDLSNEAQKGLGKVELLAGSKNEDVFVTSKREGNHSGGSLHYIGDAFDTRKFKNVQLSELKLMLGQNFDIVSESTHLHFEYDPKGGSR